MPGPPLATIIIQKIEFWRGVPVIAQALGMHERTVRRLIAAGKLPVKRDETGAWVLNSLDYYRSLQG
jgi:predicted site-specific integrase-resolvase